MTRIYRISSKAGQDYGLWSGETAKAALSAMIAEAGGDAATAGTAQDWHIKPVRSVTIAVPASPYEDSDDCLADAARDACVRYGLISDPLGARWSDDERDEILLDIPADAAMEHHLSGSDS